MQMRSLFLTTVFLVGGLVGCSSVRPSAERVERDVGEGVEQQTPETPIEWQAAADSGAVQAGWIETFDDPALTALVVEAQSNNRELAGAAANVNRAWGLARQAGAALKPDIGLSSGVDASGVANSSQPSSTNVSLGFQVSWESDVWGRLRSGRRGAIASAQAAEADYRAAQESLAAATAKAYFTAIEANLQAGIARETVALLEETQRIVNARYKEGMASSQDNSLARSDLAAARERLTALEGSQRGRRSGSRGLAGALSGR